MRNFSVQIDIEAERERKQKLATYFADKLTNEWVTKRADFTDNQRRWNDSRLGRWVTSW